MPEDKYSLINDRLYVTFALQTLLSLAFAVFGERFYIYNICISKRGGLYIDQEENSS